MTRLNYHKTGQQRQMLRNGTEQYFLPPIFASKGKPKKRRRKSSKKRKSEAASTEQITAKGQVCQLSSVTSPAQMGRIAKQLKALQRKLQCQRLGDNSYEKAISASRLSTKQLLKLQRRNRARLVAAAIAKQDSRAKITRPGTDSIKPDPKK